MERRAVVRRILGWYAAHARPLPWREPDAGAWGILVSEFMLQQTPVARVLPAWRAWLARWPTSADLAAEPAGEAVRAWGRLGYPRRARRLHAAATAIRDTHDGVVPADHAALLALPGVGPYTAAAVASFAYGRRHVVLDTNVRRVLARIDGGVALPTGSPTRAEADRAQAWLPDRARDAATWAAASMELGALVCTARSPACATCPVTDACAWYAAGRPAPTAPPRRGQTYAGTDRQCRGVLLDLLRRADGDVAEAHLLAAWHADLPQARRCLDSLLDDGLARRTGAATVAL